MRMRMRWSVAIGLILSVIAARADAGFIVSIESPGVASSQVAGAVVETFNGFDVGAAAGGRATAIGSMTAVGTAVGTAVETAGVFGSPTGKGNHLQTSGSTAIAFANPVGYFGVWLSTADAGARLH